MVQWKQGPALTGSHHRNISREPVPKLQEAVSMTRLYVVAASAICAWCNMTQLVLAQELLPHIPIIDKAEIHPHEVVVVSPHADGPEPEESVLGANLMLGYLTGIRIEGAVFREDNRAYVLEGFYGGVLTRMGSSEGAGGGARVLFRRSSRYSTNSLILGPGIDIFAQFHNAGLVLVAPTLDLAWLHGFDGGAGWETGLNIGFGIAVASNSSFGRRDHVGEVTPLISFYTGLRY